MYKKTAQNNTKPMITLAINTASSRTAIALLENSHGEGVLRHIYQTDATRGSTHKLIAENSWQSENDEAEKLMPAIHRLLQKAKKQFSDIKEVFVIKGPGSFTGLRVGVTVANTIAYLNKCPLYGITTFGYWHQLSDKPVIIFAGKGGVYLSENLNAEPELINLDQLDQTLKSRKITEVHGDISKDQKSAITAKFMDPEKTFGESMEEIIKKRHETTKNNKSEKQEQPFTIIKPLYIKPPGITITQKTCCT